MRWIRMHNAGQFDVITAIQMIGASVKNCDDPIGLYGSGVKYAMAQCLRDKIQLKIADKGKVYTLTSKEKTFRGESFEMVGLKTPTGKVYETGITSDFGKEDWNQAWFVFREFYSNMLDEGGHMDIVDGIVPSGDGVDVFLPYTVFKHIVDDIGHYFTDRDWTIREGCGRVFKKGVFVGELDGLNFDYQDDYVQITETRTLSRSSTLTRIESHVECCHDVDTWEMFLKNHECLDDFRITIYSSSTGSQKCIHEALVRLYGPDYLVCPGKPDFIAKDAAAMGYTPVIFPGGWDIRPSEYVRDYNNTAQNLVYREVSNVEDDAIQTALTKISFFLKSDTLDKVSFRVFKTDGGILGSVDASGVISLSERNFEDPDKLLETLIHEINHVQTGAEDYTREFAKGFEKALVELCK